MSDSLGAIAGGDHDEAGGASGRPGRGGGPVAGVSGHRYRRFMGVLAAVALVVILLSALLGSTGGGARGVPVGSAIPPFAAPLATGSLSGDVNFATSPGQGSAGERAACSVRGAQVLNVCQLYEEGPLVLALFVDAGSCTGVLRQMQSLVPSFPQVRFAAVAIKGESGEVRSLIRSEKLSFPVGIDRDGVLVTLYRVVSCPQVSFIYAGGIVQSPALLGSSSAATLRTRVRALLAAARGRGWR